MEFTQINAPPYPHLVDQLEFMADVVEDFAEGADEEIPYAAVAGATFALVYAHRQFDLIPDRDPEFGRADDSGVVRTVLKEYEKAFGAFAARHGLDWSKVTIDPLGYQISTGPLGTGMAPRRVGLSGDMNEATSGAGWNRGSSSP